MPRRTDDEPHVEYVLPYAGEEAPTPARTGLTLRGRVDSKLDRLSPSDQERALRLLEDWADCSTEEKHSVAWQARLHAEARRAR